MSKQTKLWGVSLLVLAFSCNANAQTCKVPPTCESMGFNQTVATCNGKTILKCPFDEAKVYCPSAIENNPVYGVGDIYKSNGIPVGIVIAISNGGKNGTIKMDGWAASNLSNANLSCLNKTTGGLSWSLPTEKQYSILNNPYDVGIWMSSGNVCKSAGSCCTAEACSCFNDKFKSCGYNGFNSSSHICPETMVINCPYTCVANF